MHLEQAQYLRTLAYRGNHRGFAPTNPLYSNRFGRVVSYKKRKKSSKIAHHYQRVLTTPLLPAPLLGGAGGGWRRSWGMRVTKHDWEIFIYWYETTLPPGRGWGGLPLYMPVCVSPDTKCRFIDDSNRLILLH